MSADFRDITDFYAEVLSQIQGRSLNRQKCLDQNYDLSQAIFQLTLGAIMTSQKPDVTKMAANLQFPPRSTFNIPGRYMHTPRKVLESKLQSISFSNSKLCGYTYLNTFAPQERLFPDISDNAREWSLQTTLMINFHMGPTFTPHLSSWPQVIGPIYLETLFWTRWQPYHWKGITSCLIKLWEA